MKRTVTIPLEEYEQLRNAEATLAAQLKSARQEARDEAFGEYLRTMRDKHAQEVRELNLALDRLKRQTAELECFQAYAYWAFDAICLLNAAVRAARWKGRHSKLILQRMPERGSSAETGMAKAREISVYRWGLHHG